MTWLLLATAALALPPQPCVLGPYRAKRPDYVGVLQSGNFPLRVHYDRNSDRDKAQLFLEAFEGAWQVQVYELGYRPPVLPDAKDGPDFDVYLASVGEFQGWSNPDNMVDNQKNDGHMGTSAYVTIDRDLPERLINEYSAHEFNHVLQWATDFTEETLPLWEGVATATQSWTYPDSIGQWDINVASFQEAPWAPSLVGDSYTIYEDWGVGYQFEYGTALWVRHLDEILSEDDGRAPALLWEATANEGWGYEPDVIDAIETTANMSLGEFMNSLALSRWLVGEDWDPRGFAKAVEWTQPRKRVPAISLSADTLPLSTDFDPQPMVTGQAFAELDPAGINDTITIRAYSSGGLHSSIAVFWWGAGGTVGELGDWGKNPAVAIDLTGLEKVVIVMSNLGKKNWDPDNANLYKQGDQLLEIELGDTTKKAPVDCGCSQGGTGLSWWLTLPLFVLLHRRRRGTP